MRDHHVSVAVCEKRIQTNTHSLLNVNVTILKLVRGFDHLVFSDTDVRSFGEVLSLLPIITRKRKTEWKQGFSVADSCVGHRTSCEMSHIKCSSCVIISNQPDKQN